MKPYYKTLVVLCRLARKDSRPQAFSITPRELILHLEQDWEETIRELSHLSIEGLVTCDRKDSYIIRITEKGWKKAATFDQATAVDLHRTALSFN